MRTGIGVDLDVDVLRRREGEVELETTGAVATVSVTSRSRSRGSRSRGSRVIDHIVAITTTALQLEDERPEQRQESKRLRHLHRGDNARVKRECT